MGRRVDVTADTSRDRRCRRARLPRRLAGRRARRAVRPKPSACRSSRLARAGARRQRARPRGRGLGRPDSPRRRGRGVAWLDQPPRPAAVAAVPWQPHRPPPAGAGSVVNRCGGGRSAVADAPSAPEVRHRLCVRLGRRVALGRDRRGARWGRVSRLPARRRLRWAGGRRHGPTNSLTAGVLADSRPDDFLQEDPKDLAGQG